MARYICEICMFEVDPKTSSVLHLITGWVKGGANTIKKVELNHHRYVHDFCTRPADDTQLPLF